MYKTYRILFILLAYIALILPNAHAQAKAQGPLKAIPAFLEANARDRDVIFNTANYNHNAKVYYLFNASEYYLNERTKFLTNISRLIFKNGADLIIHVEFSDSDKSTSNVLSSIHTGRLRNERFLKTKTANAWPMCHPGSVL